jgi:hypothetical protein
MPLWTPVENPGTRPPRSWVFDIGCALFAALASFGSFSFAQAAHPAHPALAIGLYTVAATMSRATAPAAAALAVAAEVPAAGQGGWHDGWLAALYEVIAIAAVLVAGLYVSTRRAYLAGLSCRVITRLTVFGAVPLIAAAPGKYLSPTSEDFDGRAGGWDNSAKRFLLRRPGPRRGVGEWLGQWFNIRQLTDVSSCNLQHYFQCNRHRAVRYLPGPCPGAAA